MDIPYLPSSLLTLHLIFFVHCYWILHLQNTTLCKILWSCYFFWLIFLGNSDRVDFHHKVWRWVFCVKTPNKKMELTKPIYFWERIALLGCLQTSFLPRKYKNFRYIPNVSALLGVLSFVHCIGVHWYHSIESKQGDVLKHRIHLCVDH